jgi:hypothetical protein
MILEMLRAIFSTQLLTTCLQVTIEEGRFVIMSHQRAERALNGHAEMLRQELSTAAQHLTDVFNRLEAGLQVSSKLQGLNAAS